MSDLSDLEERLHALGVRHKERLGVLRDRLELRAMVKELVAAGRLVAVGTMQIAASTAAGLLREALMSMVNEEIRSQLGVDDA